MGFQLSNPVRTDLDVSQHTGHSTWTWGKTASLDIQNKCIFNRVYF